MSRRFQTYNPIGSTSYELHTNDSEVSLKRYQYVGKERDGESGLYYYGARYYADWLCRFVSVDPLKDDYPYYTTYQYAGNKPISYIDLDGLEEGKPSIPNTPISHTLDTGNRENNPIVTPSEQESEGGSITNGATFEVIMRIAEVAEAETLYKAFVYNHQGELKKRHERKYRRKSGLKKAEKNLAYWLEIESKIDDMISTFKFVMPEEFNYLNSLPINIVINYKHGLSKKGRINPALTLIPVKYGALMKVGSDNEEDYWTEEFRGDIIISLYGGASSFNTKYLANEFGDIDYLFKYVNPTDPISFKKWKESANSDFPGYWNDPTGAGQMSFKYQYRFEEEFARKIKDLKLPFEKYDSLRKIIFVDKL